MRIVTVITSFILIFMSLWCFLHMGNTYMSVAFLIGVAMILHALGSICSYIGSYKDLQKSSWILADGIATGILGILVLANQLTVDPMIPIFFGIWIMYSGMYRAIVSTQMMMSKEGGWGWSLGFALVAIALGVYAFFNNIALALDNVLLIGIIFLVQGINMMTLAANMPGKYKIFSEEFLHIHRHHHKEEQVDFVFDSPKSSAELASQNEKENSLFSKVKMVESPVIEPIPDDGIDIAGELNKVFEHND